MIACLSPNGQNMITADAPATRLLVATLRGINVLGFPALSMPCGMSTQGLPIGLQIAGRPWEESTVLRVAHAYQQSTDWHRRRPPLGALG